MLDNEPAAASRDDPVKPAVDPEQSETTEEAGTDQAPAFDESLVGELAALIDDGKTYAEAELAFQKTRAGLAGKNIGLSVGFVLLAIILLHIAFLALAVGLVMALEPLVTIWGAIAIVVGALLLSVGLLGFGALKRGKLVGAMFAGDGKKGDEA